MLAVTFLLQTVAVFPLAIFEFRQLECSQLPGCSQGASSVNSPTRMNTWNRLLTGLTALAAFFCVLVLSPSQSAGQIRLAQYIKTTPTLSWSDISGTGTRFYPNSGGAMWYWSTASISLPFNFTMDGQTYNAGTTLGMKTGCIQFNGTPSYGINYDGLGTSSYPGRLIYWGGYYVTAGVSYYYGVDDSYNAFYYQTTGSVGS